MNLGQTKDNSIHQGFSNSLLSDTRRSRVKCTFWPWVFLLERGSNQSQTLGKPLTARGPPGPQDPERRDVRMNTDGCMHTLLHTLLYVCFSTQGPLPPRCLLGPEFPLTPPAGPCRAHCGLPQPFLQPPRALPREQAQVAGSPQRFTITNNAAMNNPVHVKCHNGYFHGSLW